MDKVLRRAERDLAEAHFDSESCGKLARASANHHVDQTCSSTSLACIGVRLHDWSVLHRSRLAGTRKYHTDHAHTSDVEKHAREPSTRQEPKDHRPPRPEFTVILHRGSVCPTQSVHGAPLVKPCRGQPRIFFYHKTVRFVGKKWQVREVLRGSAYAPTLCYHPNSFCVGYLRG